MVIPTFTPPNNPFDVGMPVRLASGEEGTIIGLLGDAHVHVGLIDAEELPKHGIGRVLDLGWKFPEISQWASGIPELEIEYAGNFLAAEGGYPSDRSWAPPGATFFVADAAEAVMRQQNNGAKAIKITLNSEAGPVHTDEVLKQLVHEALSVGLPPVIHAEGPGQAERAIACGLVALAHTPFTEILSDEVIAYAAKTNMGWISTLDIHGYGDYGNAFEIASENLRRFHEAGGRIFYGTDLGNGPLPLGINEREIRALQACGLSLEDTLDTTSNWWNFLLGVPNGGYPERWSFISDESSSTCTDFASWLATGRIVHHTDLELL